jgi:phosphoribosylanthranilate isomerase
MIVKICGITTVEDALTAASAGADFIGLNFYAASPRAVACEQARKIARALPAGVEAVGLFVNAEQLEIQNHCRRAGIRTVQLHGDEPPELVAELEEFAVIRAFRCGNDGLGPLAEYLQRCGRSGRIPDYVLIDARRAGRYGGTGQSPPWDVVARDYRRGMWPPLLLAGGLTPANVAEAIARVRPWGVDTASGVESAPGRKDAEMVRAFVRAARDAVGRAECV